VDSTTKGVMPPSPAAASHVRSWYLTSFFRSLALAAASAFLWAPNHTRGVRNRDVQMIGAFGDFEDDVHAATIVPWFEDDFLLDGTIRVGASQVVGYGCSIYETSNCCGS
jgi:hypothetical protein